MRKFGAALAMGLLLVATSACGGDGDGGGGGDRPSADEVSAALTKGGEDGLLGSAASQIDDEAADCIAEALVESDISDKALKALIAGDKDFKPSAADQKAITPVTSEMMKCMSSSGPTDVPTS
jgi:hypothetical protein